MGFEKKTDGPVSVKFTKPAFRYKGIIYKSAEVEKAAQEGSEEAQAIIANLVSLGAGCISVMEAVSVITYKQVDVEEELVLDDDIVPAPKKKSKKKGHV